MGDEWAELPVDKLSSLPSHFVQAMALFFLRYSLLRLFLMSELDFKRHPICRAPALYFMKQFVSITEHLERENLSEN